MCRAVYSMAQGLKGLGCCPSCVLKLDITLSRKRFLMLKCASVPGISCADLQLVTPDVISGVSMTLVSAGAWRRRKQPLEN